MARLTAAISVGVASLDVEENTWVGQQSTRIVEKVELFSSTIPADDDQGFRQPAGLLPILEGNEVCTSGDRFPQFESSSQRTRRPCGCDTGVDRCLSRCYCSDAPEEQLPWCKSGSLGDQVMTAAR